MGFWNELKQLGKDIGGEVANLGNELKEIGKDTIEEIKHDPKKYLIESVKDVAGGAAKVGKYMLDEGIPDAGFKVTQEMERLYRSGQLSSDRHAAHLEHRKKGVIEGQRQLNHLRNIAIPSEWDSKALSKHIRLLEKSYGRLEWFRSLPELDLDKEVLDEAKNCLATTDERIRELENQRYEMRDREDQAAKEKEDKSV